MAVINRHGHNRTARFHCHLEGAGLKLLKCIAVMVIAAFREVDVSSSVLSLLYHLIQYLDLTAEIRLVQPYTVHQLNHLVGQQHPASLRVHDN